MDIETVESHEKHYKLLNGTYYHAETPDFMIRILENIRRTHKRVRFHWGDVITGLDWGDRYDVTGTLSRSMGPIKVPILIHNSRSMGGGAILTHCIVKITETTKPHKVIYEHPSYHVLTP